MILNEGWRNNDGLVLVKYADEEILQILERIRLWKNLKQL